MYYYGVVYFRNGEASISRAFDTLEECIDATKKGVMNHAHLVKATSYITRQEKLDVMQILGCPKSRDIMRDKKFLRELSV